MARGTGDDQDEKGGVGGMARRALFTGVNMWLAAGVAAALTFVATFAFAPVRKMIDGQLTQMSADGLVGAWAASPADCAAPLVIARTDGRLEMAAAGVREALDPLEKTDTDWLSAPTVGVEMRRVAERLEMRLVQDPRSVTIYVRCAA